MPVLPELPTLIHKFHDSSPLTDNVTGRWTREEHLNFIKGLELHGKGWKKIAALIKTRTVVQIRTHAQKYFLKLQKARNESNGKAQSESKIKDVAKKVPLSITPLVLYSKFPSAQGKASGCG